MADPRFDRIHPGRSRGVRDPDGKQALFSVAPESPPEPTVMVVCHRCGTYRGLGWRDLLTMLRPPLVVIPWRGGRLYARCPACTRRSVLELHLSGPVRAVLRRLGEGWGD